MVSWEEEERRTKRKRLENKINKLKSKNKEVSEKLQVKYEAQKERNIRRDIYNSNTSTGKLIAQKLLLGRSGADAYRVARASNENNSRLEAAIPALVQRWSGLPVSTAISAKAVEAEISRNRGRKRYA